MKYTPILFLIISNTYLVYIATKSVDLLLYSFLLELEITGILTLIKILYISKHPTKNNRPVEPTEDIGPIRSFISLFCFINVVVFIFLLTWVNISISLAYIYQLVLIGALFTFSHSLSYYINFLQKEEYKNLTDGDVSTQWMTQNVPLITTAFLFLFITGDGSYFTEQNRLSISAAGALILGVKICIDLMRHLSKHNYYRSGNTPIKHKTKHISWKLTRK